MSVRGLTILLATADRTRWRSALGLAAAQAALGGRVRLFLDAGAVALLATTGPAPAGLPDEAEMIDTAAALGVRIVACQTGLAAAGLRADALDSRITTGGITGMLADLADDRLVAL